MKVAKLPPPSLTGWLKYILKFFNYDLLKPNIRQALIPDIEFDTDIVVATAAGKRPFLRPYRHYHLHG